MRLHAQFVWVNARPTRLRYMRPTLSRNSLTAENGAMKLLIVEDDDSLRKSAVRMLRLEGFDIVEAVNAEEACTRCADYAPDLLFTDIHLPGTLNGWDVAERCRERDPRIPVVYTTAFPGHAPRPVPGSLILNKPYTRHQLLDALRSLCQAHAVAPVQPSTE